MNILDIEVNGMKCGGCAKKITQYFKMNSDVENVEVDLENKRVKIISSSEFSSMKVRNDLVELGFSVISLSRS